MKKHPASESLTAAECARRTGLTVRALRVYERAGLLKPARSASGWRLYGPDELIRLNTIVALKGFGLSLREIRKAFGSSPPALLQVLDLQARNWAARKLAAEHTLSLLHAAIARLRSRASLSIDELCELMRNTEVNNMQAIVRELINQHITPEQEREWLTWWAKRKPAEVVEGEAQRERFRAIVQEFHALMKRGAAVDSPEVQAVVEHSQRAWLDSDLRQWQLEQLAWNPEVTQAWFALGGKLMARTAVPESAEEAAQLERYIQEARRASRSSRLLIPLALEAKRLRGAGTPVDAPEARALVERFAQVCRDEGMGDPVIHARWIAAFGPNEDSRPGWQYLAEACSN
jgi:DNA-binding transcriptional MerR regulator